MNKSSAHWLQIVESTKKCWFGTVVALLLAAIPLPAAPEEPLSSLNFQENLGYWAPEKTTIATEEVLNGVASFARIEAKANEIAHLSSPIWKNNLKKFVEIQFRYRSTVARSSRDVGSWVYIPFFNNKGQDVGNEAILLDGAPEWKEIRQRFAVPEEATQWQVQLRVQNTGGRLDVDDVQVRYASGLEAPVASEEPDGAAWKEVAQWSLNRENDGASMQGTSVLPSVPIAEDAKALAFVLPDQYTERTDLIYDITVEFVPRWNVNEAGNYSGLFVLGRNMHGYEPPALSMLVWDTHSLYSRVTAKENQVMQVIHRPGFRAGQVYRARSIVTADTLSAYGNQKLLGRGTIVGQFKWPKRKKFFVGAEDANLSHLQGDIKEFTLRIWQPRTRVAWTGGADAGYFFGQKNLAMSLDFPDANGLARDTNFSIFDINERQVFRGKSTERTASRHALKLQPLANGWYRMEAEVEEKTEATRPRVQASRSFVVLPPISQPEAAPLSSLGITEEISISEGFYDPVLVEGILKRSSQMGVRWWRLWVAWDAIEPEPGKFQWKNLDHVMALAQKHGMETLVCLRGGAKPWQAYGGGERPDWHLMSEHTFAPRNMADWNKFVRAISTHLKGKVRHWQVWNEPDARNGFYPFSTEKYVEVLRESARVLREVDAQNVVATGGFAGAFASAGQRDKMTHTNEDHAWGLAEFFALKPQSDFDVFDNHYYAVDEPGQSWDSKIKVVNDVKKWLAVRNIKTRLWNSETSMYSAPGKLAGTRGGWANVPYLSEKEQAQRIVELHIQSLSVGIEKTFWYGVRGDVGVINADMSPKPAFATHAVLAAKLHGFKFDTALDLGATTRAYRFSARQGTPRYLTVAWERGGSRKIRLSGQPLRFSDWMDNIHALAPGQLTFDLGVEPVYIESSQPLNLTVISSPMKITP
jgi:hypothetical protein